MFIDWIVDLALESDSSGWDSDHRQRALWGGLQAHAWDSGRCIGVQGVGVGGD